MHQDATRQERDLRLAASRRQPSRIARSLGRVLARLAEHVLQQDAVKIRQLRKPRACGRGQVDDPVACSAARQLGKGSHVSEAPGQACAPAISADALGQVCTLYDHKMQYQCNPVIARSVSDEAIQNGTAAWIAHMGMCRVKVSHFGVTSLFERGAPLRPERGVLKMARADRVKVGPQGRRAAAWP